MLGNQITYAAWWLPKFVSDLSYRKHSRLHARFLKNLSPPVCSRSREQACEQAKNSFGATKKGLFFLQSVHGTFMNRISASFA
jgi:hypothetical protein